MTRPCDCSSPKIRPLLLGGLLSLGLLGHADCAYADVMAFWKAVDIAQARNPQIHKAEALLRAAREDNPKTLAKLLPSVNFKAIDVLREGTHYQRKNTSLHSDPKTVLLTVDQPLFHGPFWIDHAQSNVHIEAAFADLSTMRQEITLRVATVTSNWLEAKEVLNLAIKYKKVTQKHMEENRIRLEAGEGTQTDLEQASSRAHQAKASYQDALNTLEKETAYFREVIGESPDETLELPDYTWEEPTDLNAKIWKWIEDRPEIWAARARLQETSMTEEMEKSGHWPTVNLNYTASHTWDSERGGSSGVSFKDEENAHSVSVALTLPLFSGFETLAKTREAKAFKEASIAELDRVRTLARREVEEARSDLKINKSAITSLENALEFSKNASTGLEESFLAGTRTLLDLLDSQFEVHTLSTTLVRHRYKAQLALIRLWVSLGRIMHPTSPAIPNSHEESTLIAQAGRDEVIDVVYKQMEIALLNQDPLDENRAMEANLMDPEAVNRLLLSEFTQNQPISSPTIGQQARPLAELKENQNPVLFPETASANKLVANQPEKALPEHFPAIWKNGSYMVHVGTYFDESTLVTTVKILGEAGIPSWSEQIKTPDNKNLCRLLVGPFATHDDVMNAMAMVNKQTGQAVGWIPFTHANNQNGIALRISQSLARVMH